MRNKRNAGFTLVEIMIVVAIIGLLAAIAVPSFMKARETSQQNACINNLRQIDGAIDQWAIENNMSTGEDVVDTELDEYIKAGYPPECPAGGAYSVTVIGDPPECTEDGHELPTGA